MTTTVTPDGKNRWKIVGDLTLHGVTKEATLDVESAAREKESLRAQIEATGIETKRHSLKLEIVNAERDRADLLKRLKDRHLAVARSGSVTLNEFAATGLPAVFIPYPVGNGEQRYNAADVVAAGGALLVDDADFTPGWIAGTLVPLMRDEPRLAAMAVNMAGAGSRDGADRMVALVLDAAK